MIVNYWDIIKKSFLNINKNIGQVILVSVIVFACMFGIFMFEFVFSFIPLFGWGVQIIAKLFTSFLAIAIFMLCIKVYRNDKPNLKILENLFDETKINVYIKVIVGRVIVMVTNTFLLFGFLFYIFFIAIILSESNMVLYYGELIFAFYFIIILCISLFALFVLYCVLMFLSYVFFIAIDAKKSASTSDIFSFANRLVTGHRLQHFVLGFITTLIVISAILFIIGLYFSLTVFIGWSEIWFLVFGYIPITIISIFIIMEIILFKITCFAGLYEKLLINYDERILIYEIYDKEFIEDLKKSQK